MAKKRNKSKFTRFFEELANDAKVEALKALDKGADVVVDDAKHKVPVKSGALKASIHKEPIKSGRSILIKADALSEIRTNKKTGESYGGDPYGQYVEFDPKRSKPFLYPAMDAQRDKVKEMVADAIREAVKNNGKH